MRDARTMLAEFMVMLTPEQLVAFVELQAAQAAEAAARAAVQVPLTPRQQANARHYQRRKAGLTGSDPKIVSDRIKTIKIDSDAAKTGSDGSEPILPAPALDGRPPSPTPQPPTLNPSPTLESQTGAGAPADDVEGQDGQGDEEGGEDAEAGKPAAAADKRTKAEKPRMNDWPDDYREQFWSAYPRRVAKKPAMKELERIYFADKVPFFEIMEGVKLLSRLGLEMEYVKHPDSWLRNERWNDDQTSRLNSRKTSTNSSNRMTLAAESKTFWHDTAKAADEQIRRRAHEQRNDRDTASGPVLDHEPRSDPRAAAEPRTGQRPDDRRPGAAGRPGDRLGAAQSFQPARIPGW